MAEDQGSEGSVANSSSTTSNLWELHGNPISSWNNVISWHHPSATTTTATAHNNSNNSSGGEEEISISPSSFTNTSNHSGLSEESSRRLMEPTARQLAAVAGESDLTGEPTSENHLWSQVLLSVGSNGDLHNTQDVGENFLEVLSSKNLSTAIFEPACDYLKKMDTYCWDYPASSPSSYNNIERHLNSFNNGNFLEHERLNNLSNLVSNWSIAPPFPDLNRQITPQQSRNMSLNNSMDHYSSSDPDLSMMKHSLSSSITSSPPYVVQANENIINNSAGYFPCYGHEFKAGETPQQQHHHHHHHQEIESSDHDASIHRFFKSNNLRHHQTAGNNYGMSEAAAPWANTRSLTDVITFNGCLNKPLMADLHQSPKPAACLKTTSSTENKKQGQSISLQGRGNGRGAGASVEAKKKRCEENSETVQFKKPKHEASSTASSAKAQVPKVKLADRITALQQIVSPFGKTDTASVLQEAIGYIKFLQEQVQLLSNPYMKSSANKDPWGMLERKDKAGEAKFDLKSRGLCLVPVACTPQVYRDNTGSDYWTPAYRGCLYR